MSIVSLLDHSDLQCPEGHGQMGPSNRLVSLTAGYVCNECFYFITQIEFLRNSHGTREQRRSRIASRELGRA